MPPMRRARAGVTRIRSLHGCAPRLVEQFIRSGSAAKLEGKCLERIPRPLFLLPLGNAR